MNKKENKRKKDIEEIKKLFHEEVEISIPEFLGEVHYIYIVKTTSGKHIFRFSNKEDALRNAHSSRILRKYNIPVPDIASYRIGKNDEYIETYTYIEGKTLYERNREGISKEKIKDIYKQLYDICCKMAKIPVKELLYSHDGTKEFDYKVKKKDLFFGAMNLSPLVVGHDDLHDKNILLDENDNVCAILDLDAIRLKPFVLLLVRLVEEGKKYGYDIESIKELDSKAYNNGKLLNIKQQLKLYNKIHPFFNGEIFNRLKKRDK